jgi:hypothetical protein
MSMQKKGKTDRTLCLNFCRYYKPGKNEDLLCQGIVIVHDIMRGGKKLQLERPVRAAVPNAATLEELKGRVCAVCAFRRSDCDYMLTGGTAPPCGGFVLLSHLLGTGELMLEEIR